jgi:uncharacterized membrane protein YfcA
MDMLVLLLIGLINFVIVSLFTLSGGIGLVMRPILIFLGVPPQITIGTSRTSAIPGSILAQFVLHKSKKIDWKLAMLLAPMHVLGGLLGIFVITSLDDVILKKVIGVLLLLGGFILIIKNKVGLKKAKASLGKLHLLISWPIIFVLGTLLVIIGGVGPLGRLLFIFGYGKTHIEAAAIQKAINFWQTLVTAGIFIWMVLIDWFLLLALILSGTLGNYVGTKLVLKKGEVYLRYLLLIVIFVSAIKLIFFT